MVQISEASILSHFRSHRAHLRGDLPRPHIIAGGGGLRRCPLIGGSPWTQERMDRVYGRQKSFYLRVELVPAKPLSPLGDLLGCQLPPTPRLQDSRHFVEVVDMEHDVHAVVAVLHHANAGRAARRRAIEPRRSVLAPSSSPPWG